MSIGENIRNYRKEKGLTQKELAELVGLTASTITKYEKDMIEPGVYTLTKIADALGTNLYRLINSPLYEEDDFAEYDVDTIINLTTTWLREILCEDITDDEKIYLSNTLFNIFDMLEFVFNLDSKYQFSDKREAIEIYQSIQNFILYLCYSKGYDPSAKQRITNPRLNNKNV